MIKNRDIIVFSDDWGRFPSTVQHIIKYFLPFNRVLWVGSIGLRKPRLTFKDLIRALRKLNSLFIFSEKKVLPKNLYYLSPFVIPWHDFLIFRKVNNYILKKQLFHLLNQYSFSNIILFTSNPIISNLFDFLKPHTSIYFCLDDYTKFDGAFKYIRQGEIDLLKIVKITYCVSDQLVKTRKQLNKECHYLPQGIHLNHFKQKINYTKSKNSKLVVGYFGLLADWVNIDLIVKASQKYPEFEFLIIGPCETDISNFKICKNINYIGPKKFDELPEYASKFDLGIIPFKINNLTIAVNPLKLLEYLAIGLPVVSVRLPEVEKFADLVKIADNDDEFINLIKSAIEENDSQSVKKRLEVASLFSWEVIAEEISKKIKSIENLN